MCTFDRCCSCCFAFQSPQSSSASWLQCISGRLSAVHRVFLFYLGRFGIPFLRKANPAIKSACRRRRMTVVPCRPLPGASSTLPSAVLSSTTMVQLLQAAPGNLSSKARSRQPNVDLCKDLVKMTRQLTLTKAASPPPKSASLAQLSRCFRRRNRAVLLLRPESQPKTRSGRLRLSTRIPDPRLHRQT